MIRSLPKPRQGESATKFSLGEDGTPRPNNTPLFKQIDNNVMTPTFTPLPPAAVNSVQHVAHYFGPPILKQTTISVTERCLPFSLSPRFVFSRYDHFLGSFRLLFFLPGGVFRHFRGTVKKTFGGDW